MIVKWFEALVHRVVYPLAPKNTALQGRDVRRRAGLGCFGLHGGQTYRLYLFLNHLTLT